MKRCWTLVRLPATSNKSGAFFLMTNYEIKTCFNALGAHLPPSTWRWWKEQNQLVKEKNSVYRPSLWHSPWTQFSTFLLFFIFVFTFLIWCRDECEMQSVATLSAYVFFFCTHRSIFASKCKITHLQSHCRHLTIINSVDTIYSLYDAGPLWIHSIFRSTSFVSWIRLCVCKYKRKNSWRAKELKMHKDDNDFFSLSLSFVSIPFNYPTKKHVFSTFTHTIMQR